MQNFFHHVNVKTQGIRIIVVGLTMASKSVFYITGASRGLGRAMVSAALRSGALKVYGISRWSAQNVEDASRYEDVVLDLSNPQNVSSFNFADPPKDAKRVVLILNAGTVEPLSYIGDMESAQLLQSLNTNAISPALMVNNFLKKFGGSSAVITKRFNSEASSTAHMDEHMGRSTESNNSPRQFLERVVINISSGAAMSAYDSWGAYCSSKAFTQMLCSVLEKEVRGSADKHTHVFSIAPGVVDTDMQRDIREKSPEHFSNKKRFMDLHANQELWSPDDVAAKVLEVAHSPEKQEECIFRIRL